MNPCQTRSEKLACPSAVLLNQIKISVRAKTYDAHWILFDNLLLILSLSQLVLSSPLEVFVFFRYHLGMAYISAQCTSSDAVAERHWGEVIFIVSTRVNTLVFARILLGMSITSLCDPLGSNSARQRSQKYFDSPSNQPLLTEITFE